MIFFCEILQAIIIIGLTNSLSTSNLVETMKEHACIPDQNRK